MIRLETFNEADFDRLINWAVSEEILVQFSGPIFKFPLTKKQLEKYLTEKKSIAFKVVDTESGEIIGHSEIYHSENSIAKLCRILIGDESFRGKGIGEQTINKLVEYSFEKLNVEKVELNVYDWNKSAIRCYEKSGFVINPNKVSEIDVKGSIWTSLNMILEKSKWQNRT